MLGPAFGHDGAPLLLYRKYSCTLKNDDIDFAFSGEDISVVCWGLPFVMMASHYFCIVNTAVLTIARELRFPMSCFFYSIVLRSTCHKGNLL
jgi:hypothetical protein